MLNIERNTFLRLLKKYQNGKARAEKTKPIENLLGDDLSAIELRIDLKDGSQECKEMKTETDGPDQPVGGFILTVWSNHRLGIGIVSLVVAFALLFRLSLWNHNRETGSAGNTFTDATAKKKNVVFQLANGNTVRVEGSVFGIDTTLPANSAAKTIGQGQLDTKYATANNTVIVPAGLTYALELTDGTKAYLNSGTQLKFPLRFNDTKREVTMDEGEMYIKVAPQGGKLFVIHTAQGYIKTEGGTFNVAFYDNELTVSLVSGEAHVKGPSDQSAVALQPGFQALRSAQQRNFTIQDFEKLTLLEWLKGRKTFSDETLQKVGSLLERAYGIDVIIDDVDLAQRRLGGAVVTTIPVDTILDNICKTGGFYYYYDEQKKVHFCKKAVTP